MTNLSTLLLIHLRNVNVKRFIQFKYINRYKHTMKTRFLNILLFLIIKNYVERREKGQTF